jgi:hypothetical protein
VRVLRTGGRFATSVWDSKERNPWIATLMGVLQRNIELPPPPPGSPGMFRCAAPDMIASLLREAGLNAVTEDVVPGRVTYDSPAHYWTMMTEVAAPVAGALAQVSDGVRSRVRDELFAALGSAEAPVVLEYSARVVTGTK